jgi:ribonuclease BN (tRNA processing enzyme)
MIGRRTLLGTALAAGVPFSARPAAGGSRTRLVLLGTKGGPSPSLVRAQPGNLLLVDGESYLVDCGYGVIHQLLKVGVSPEQLRGIFVTHHHFDHNADLGTTLMTAWACGLDHEISVIAPPPLRSMIDGYLAFSDPDIHGRMQEEGRRPLAPLLRIAQVAKADVVYRDDRLTVRAHLVDHWTMKPALAFRFDTADRSIVISGDTAYDPGLADFARGADMLVHEALYPAALTKHTNGATPTMLEHLVKSHTSAQDVGRIAAAAGVRTLVLTHLVPNLSTISDTMWISEARRHFDGEVVVGHDLMAL